MTAKMKYSDYLTRLARNSTKTAQELSMENIVREVGKSYGLSEIECKNYWYEWLTKKEHRIKPMLF